MKFEKLEISENGVSFREGFRKLQIPFEDISRAFIRVQEVNGKLCCGNAVFTYFRMVFVDRNGKEFADYICENEKAMDEALAYLHSLAPEIAIGYVKSGE